MVSLNTRQIEVYADPASAAKRSDYRQRRDYGPSDTIPVVLDGVEVGSLPIQDVLP